MCAETQIFKDTYGKTAANSVDIAQVRADENLDHIYWKLTIFLQFIIIKIIIVSEPIWDFYIVSTTSPTTKSPVTSPKPTTRAMTSTRTREPTTLPTGAGTNVSFTN